MSPFPCVACTRVGRILFFASLRIAEAYFFLSFTFSHTFSKGPLKSRCCLPFSQFPSPPDRIADNADFSPTFFLWCSSPGDCRKRLSLCVVVFFPFCPFFPVLSSPPFPTPFLSEVEDQCLDFLLLRLVGFFFGIKRRNSRNSPPDLKGK